jgi:hypothetical protein
VILLAALACAVVAAAALVLAARPEGPGTVRPPAGVFVPSVPGERAVLWAVGDGADGSARARALAARIAAGPIDRLLYLGDVYGSGGLLSVLRGDGSAEDFRRHYATVYGRLASRTAPTPGNHEWPRRREGYDAYWTQVHGPPPAYYAFDAAGWRILSLNSEAPHDTGSAQLRWLTREVRPAGTCRLAFWHRPRHSAGRQGDQPDVAPLWDALEGRARIVLGGHDHNMQRLRPIRGLTQWISGAGGRELHATHRDRRVAFSADGTLGALRIDLRPGRALLRFVARDGRVLDRHRVTCRRR